MKETTDRFSLRQLNLMVRDAIEDALPSEYWVEAELSECRERGGHCYLELVEKDERSNTPVARASAKCWRQTWLMVQPYFERTTGQPLRAGMKVLLRVYAQFHEAYGFSWIVTDIDPTYTIGDMARRRQQIVEQLKDEGVFDLQRELHLPMFTQRVAVISAETAAGYGDFRRQLLDNDYGLRFSVELFPAIMQGGQVEQSVIAALDRINARMDEFDCVVIIRGGGAVADMSGFDTLALAENVAQFPLPIITGIGHERDESVLDMVAHLRVKTPTAAAALLVGRLKQTADLISDAEMRMVHYAKARLSQEQMRLQSLSERIPQLFATVKTRQEARLDQLMMRLTTALGNRLQRERHQLELLTQQAEAQDPQRLLRRGYSITLHEGHAVRDASRLKPGTEIETRVEKGIIKSTIK